MLMLLVHSEMMPETTIVLGHRLLRSCSKLYCLQPASLVADQAQRAGQPSGASQDRGPAWLCNCMYSAVP